MKKYQNCRSLIKNINVKESYELKKLKRFFLLRNDVPVLNTLDETDEMFDHPQAQAKKSFKLFHDSPSNQKTIVKKFN